MAMTEERVKAFLLAMIECACGARNRLDPKKDIPLTIAFGDYPTEGMPEDCSLLSKPLVLGDLPKGMCELIIQAASLRCPSDFILSIAEGWMATVKDTELERILAEGVAVADRAGSKEVIMINMRTNTGRRYSVMREVVGGRVAEGAATEWLGFGEGAQKAEDRFLDAAVLRD